MAIRQTNGVTMTPHVEFGSIRDKWSLSYYMEPVTEKDIPKWVRGFDGFKMSAQIRKRTSELEPATLIVNYLPENPFVDRKGFTMLYFIADIEMEKLEKIWQVAANYFETNASNREPKFKMFPNGKIYGMSMTPNIDDITEIWRVMMEVYENWIQFPNTEDYDMVKQLVNATNDIDQLNHELKHHYIQREIDEKVAHIKSLQETVVELEKTLNYKYERGADAQNLLEENGYPEKAKLWQEGDPYENDREQYESYVDQLIEEIDAGNVQHATLSNTASNTTPNTASWANYASQNGCEGELSDLIDQLTEDLKDY